MAKMWGWSGSWLRLSIGVCGFLFALTIRADYLPGRSFYEVCFTPEQNCQRLIIQEILRARQSIDVQSYSFTSYPIAKALIQAQKRGVKVRLILDKSQFQPGHDAMAAYLLRHHILIWKDCELNIAHNKVMIFDQRTVETGSFNYTNSAQKYNAENVLIINSPRLAGQYAANWQRRKSVSVLVPSN